MIQEEMGRAFKTPLEGSPSKTEILKAGEIRTNLSSEKIFLISMKVDYGPSRSKNRNMRIS